MAARIRQRRNRIRTDAPSMSTTATLSLSRKRSSYAKKDTRLAILLILPAAAAIFLVMILPLGFAIYASFFHYSVGTSFVPAFFDNYVAFFTDPTALQALLNTVLFTILSLTLCICIGVGISVLLKSISMRMGNVMRAIFAMPLLISPIIVSLIWRYMYDPTYGLVYFVLNSLGIKDFGGLTSSSTALICVVIADVWHATPFIILVTSAGLTSIPEELYEAARIDGAGAFRTLISITLPLLSKVLVILILIRGTDAFRVFDIIYGLTGGGPGNSTLSLSLYAYQQAYTSNQMGYAMAVSVITLIALVVLFGPFMRNSARSIKA
jgi:ABC-type sugar transport system permease subunit